MGLSIFFILLHVCRRSKSGSASCRDFVNTPTQLLSGIDSRIGFKRLPLKVLDEILVEQKCRGNKRLP